MEEQRPLEVLREHLDECLKHFANRITTSVAQRSRNAAAFRKPMVDFLAVTDGTIQRLLYGLGAMPVGENRIKLMFYLDLHGYKVIELERMRRTKVLGNFAELIGYSVLSAAEATEQVGFQSKREGGGVSSLYQVLRGEEGLGKEREDRMWTIWKEHRSDIDKKRKEALERYLLKLPLPHVEMFVRSEKSPTSGVSRKATLNIIDGLLDLLKGNPFEGISEIDLEATRVSHGSSILELSSKLSELGSKLIQPEKVG